MREPRRGDRGPFLGYPLLRRVVPVEPAEVRGLLWSAAYFFSLLAGYYLLRPVRDAIGAEDRRNLSLLFFGTLGGTLVTNPLFSALVARFPRRKFLPSVYHFFAANLLVFYLLLGSSSAGAAAWAGRAFFVWLSVFNMFVVSVFWGFMADLFRSGQGKRLFAFIAGGGTLGAIAGSSSAAALAGAIDPALFLLLAAGMLEACVLCIHRLVRLFGLEREEGGKAPAETGSLHERAGRLGVRDFLAGIRLFAASRYLLGIGLFVLAATVGATFIYFQQAGIAEAAFPDRGARTAFFARIDLFVNLLTATFEFLLTGRLLTRIGVGPTLSIFPALTAASSLALALWPSSALLVGVQTLRRGAEYGIARPAREVLFTVVPREEKYAAKNFLDTFVVRAGDAIAATVDRALPKSGIGERAVAAALCLLAAGWVLLALALGRRQDALARRGGDA
ncbi:MAG: MFS transporter [Planctomycetes bacterium]|nr:MFS transporter [Planctomycetota bacterium]